MTCGVKEEYIRQHGDPATNGKGHQVTLHPKGHEVALVPRKISSLRRTCGAEAHLTQPLDVGGFALGDAHSEQTWRVLGESSCALQATGQQSMPLDDMVSEIANAPSVVLQASLAHQVRLRGQAGRPGQARRSTANPKLAACL